MGGGQFAKEEGQGGIANLRGGGVEIFGWSPWEAEETGDRGRGKQQDRAPTEAGCLSAAGPADNRSG